VPAELGGFAIASRYVSASHDALVGGDLYDAVATSRGVRVLVGDVRGKGLPAVRTAAHALSAFRQLAARPELRLVDVAAALDESLQGDLGEEDFVTAVLCELGPLRTLEIVNCGHPGPLLVPAAGAPRELSATRPALPLGLGTHPVPDRYRLDAGDRLLLFTDGLSEARDGHGVFLDLAAHADLLRAPDLQHAVDGLLAAAAQHAGGTLADDVAVLLVDVADSGAGLPAGTARRLLTGA
jgi:serine phosphatase RsbU (regulator of sigma subunit)